MSTPSVADPDAIRALRTALDRAPFTGEAIQKALGTEDDILSRHRSIPVHLRRLSNKGSFGALIQLFVLNVATPRELLTDAIAPLTVDAVQAMNLVRVEGDLIRPIMRLVPHDELIIASDLRLRPGEPAPHDHVPGVHRPSVTLSHLTVRKRVARGLDLGTGCGVEAILMSRHVDRVVGSDVNARAIDFARFNGVLNDAANIDWRVGSWFEPMREERFDLIACNPPYVISPATQYIYRDSGMEGDSVSEQVVREVAAHLGEGGFATVTISWASDPSDEDAQPVRRWIEGLGCDAWILSYRVEDPLSTAKNWNEQDATDAAAFGKVLDEWLAYYERLGIESIAYGAVVLRRRSAGTNWVRVDPMPTGRLQPASVHIQRVFAAQDHLRQTAADDGVLDERFRVPPTVRLTQSVRFNDSPPSFQLSLEEGLGFQATVDRYIVRVLQRLDGGTLREVLAEAAATSGIAPADRPQFVSAGVTLARRLYGLGLIERSNDDGGVRPG